MDGETFDQRLEQGILGVVLAVVAFSALATGAVRSQDFAVAQGLTVVGLALWVLRFWVNPSHRLQWPPACWAVLAFVVYALVRYRQADVEYVARQELLRILVYASLFLLVLNNLHRQETTRVLFAALLVLAALISLYALYEFLADSQRVWHFHKPDQYRGRGSGTFICPNHLAGFLELLLPVALALVLISRSKALGRVFYGYLAIIILTGIGVSISRGGWLACGLALVAFCGFLLRYPDYRRLTVLALAVVAVAAVLFVFNARHAQKRIRHILTPGQLESVQSRPLLWAPALRMWRDHPWFGVGPAHFDVRFPKYRTEYLQTRPYWVHNDYLNALVDWGAVGGALIGTFLALLTHGAVRTWRYVQRAPSDLGTKRSDRAAYVLGMSTGLVALAAHAVVEFNLQVPANAILAIVIMASLTSHLRFATDRYWVSVHRLGRLAVTVVGLLAIVYLGRHVPRRYLEGAWLTRAAAASLAAEQEQTRAAQPGATNEVYRPKPGLTAADQAHALQSAFACEPGNPETVARIGEIVRLQSWEGGPEWRRLAEAAIDWFSLGERLNPYDAYCHVRHAMCLDWLGRYAEATPRFEKALQVDQNSYYVTLMRGWHELQQGHYAEAKKWFDDSKRIKDWANPLADTYLEIVRQRLAQTPPPPAQP